MPRVAYELGLLFALLIFGLAPFHGARTLHRNIQTIDGGHFSVSLPQGSVSVGDEFPIFRFNPDAKNEIARARVESAQGDTVKFAYVPGTITEPVARQGRVLAANGQDVTVGLGSALGLAEGDNLVVFDGRTAVGRVVVAHVQDQTSLAQVALGTVHPGMTVSEFTVATQVAIFRNQTLSVIEMSTLLLLPLLYAVGWIRWRRSPLEASGEEMRSLVRRLDTQATRILISALFGVPFVWLAAEFIAGLVAYIGERVSYLFLPAQQGSDAAHLTYLLKDNLVVLYVIGGLAYAFVLITTRKPPPLLLWKSLSFKGGPLSWTASSNGFWIGAGGSAALLGLGIYRQDLAMGALGAVLLAALAASQKAKGLAIWLLHLLVFYAFATTLFSFMVGDLSAALATAWPGSGVEVRGSLQIGDPSQLLDFFATSAKATMYMLTHAPTVTSAEAGYVLARYVLWTITIIGCLIGYGHSILGYFSGKRIRNLDFTLAGWTTNAVCYGPLLGVVVWHYMSWPALRGPDPIVTSGPLSYAYLLLELFLDIVYMLTIWNLGVLFGVMTDKGVRTTGFYGVVRHPSYTMEALMFVALELKALSTGMHWLAVSMFLITYWLRSEREDDFMTRSNPEFASYREATPYKFIPGIY